MVVNPAFLPPPTMNDSKKKRTILSLDQKLQAVKFCKRHKLILEKFNISRRSVTNLKSKADSILHEGLRSIFEAEER